MSSPAFDFGENWQNFSQHALNEQRVAEAARDFHVLCAGLELSDRKFLDIGFGQGLGLLNAAAAGAHATGCDINPLCAEVLGHNRRLFPVLTAPIPVVVGSILDQEVVARLRQLSGGQGYDIVHSWGVLHHTGDMARAIEHAASLVGPHGYFIVALYNRHWSSGAWWLIKWSYVHSPRWVQRALVALFYPVIYLAKWVVTGKNPKQQERGMNFYYDVIDWVGGYPYEYASREEIERRLAAQGFQSMKFIAARVPTGCNEFVFQRT